MIKELRHIQLHDMMSYLKAVVASLVLCFTIQGCDKESNPCTPEEAEEVPISMNSASVEGMETSRALITDNTGLQAEGVGFGVYATKTVASNNTPTLVFNNVKVTHDDTKGWSYSPTKYWDRTAYYDFIAYTPYYSNETNNTSVVKTNYNESKNTLIINEIPNWQEIDGEEVDYLVAHDEGQSIGYYITESEINAVTLSFQHILAQLEVRIVKNEFLQNSYYLTDVTYANVPNNGASTSTYTYSGTMPGTMEREMITSDNPIDMLEETSKEVTTNTEDVAFKHLVVPFALTGEDQITINVTYKVGDSGQPTTIPVSTGIDQLQAGKRYLLTLTFNSGSSIIPSVEIENWTDVNVDEDPKYNW